MDSQVTDTCVLLGTEGCSRSYACVLGGVVNPVVETVSCLPYPVFVPFFLANRTLGNESSRKITFLRLLCRCEWPEIYVEVAESAFPHLILLSYMLPGKRVSWLPSWEIKQRPGKQWTPADSMQRMSIFVPLNQSQQNSTSRILSHKLTCSQGSVISS